MTTIEIEIYRLCEDIDFYKSEADKMKKEADYWKGQYTALLNDSIKHDEKMRLNVLEAILSQNK